MATLRGSHCPSSAQKTQYVVYRLPANNTMFDGEFRGLIDGQLHYGGVVNADRDRLERSPQQRIVAAGLPIL